MEWHKGKLCTNKKGGIFIMAKSSTGMEENVAALLSYIFGFITGLIFFLIEKESKFVRFHAMQSIVFSVALLIIYIILGIIPVIGWILIPIVGLIGFVVWILLLIKAYQGNLWKLPVLGNLAEKWSGSAAV